MKLARPVVRDLLPALSPARRLQFEYDARCIFREATMSDQLTVSPTATSQPPQPLTQEWIDQRIFDLYDEYCHGRIDRREFLARAALVTGGLVMAQALMPRYALAQTISFTDPRIKARYVGYLSPGGTSGTMRGYLVAPIGQGPFPAVLVIHENRGLNPYIEDVARRVATEGFLALAPDGLAPIGGYPGNDDDGRTDASRTACGRPGEIRTAIPQIVGSRSIRQSTEAGRNRHDAGRDRRGLGRHGENASLNSAPRRSSSW
jgi:hypothetical protein